MVSLSATASSLGLITRFIRQVFPLVDTELAAWQKQAGACTCPELAEQALASIRDKKFHCQGGSIYSLYPGVDTGCFVRLVVALQTISDYLDNLCDRAGVADETAFRQLHLAMTDALDPVATLQDYYAGYPLKNDGGYLAALVKTCQDEVKRLPSYELVKPAVLDLAKLYSELQTYKHLDTTIREQKMAEWANCRLSAYPGLTLWEFAAATGSTLGMFMLCAAAADPALNEETVRQILSSYFPWICGLHILLDYFIDRAEDRRHGDLNFTTYYADDKETTERLNYFTRQALNGARRLAKPAFAEMVVHGLLAMYLSDPKTNAPPEKAMTATILAATGDNYTGFMYTLCRLLRKQRILS